MKIHRIVLLIFMLNLSIYAESWDASTGHTEPRKRLWEGHAQYLFAQFSINLSDDDYFNWGTDIDEKESMVGIEYYLQLHRRFYAKAGFGKADYTYTERYVSTGALVERKDAEFDYAQAGLAFALYDDDGALITIDLDYMNPLNGSVTKEKDGVETDLDDPQPKAVASLNANYCFKHACLGTGLSTTRYAGTLIWYFRIGGTF